MDKTINHSGKGKGKNHPSWKSKRHKRELCYDGEKLSPSLLSYRSSGGICACTESEIYVYFITLEIDMDNYVAYVCGE